ncbi:MAG: hypothetical protein ACRDNS_28985 [Trebonia sp.]
MNEVPCRGCGFPAIVDVAGLCHDCAWVMADDPGMAVDDLQWVMPGPEDIR